MQNTGETEAFEATCPNSGSCKRLIDLVHSYYDAGGYFKTGKWKVTRVKATTGSGDEVQLNVAIKSAPTEYKTSADSPVQRFAGGVTDNLLDMKWSIDHWVIQEWTQRA
jgi:hypothetical protein